LRIRRKCGSISTGEDLLSQIFTHRALFNTTSLIKVRLTFLPESTQNNAAGLTLSHLIVNWPVFAILLHTLYVFWLFIFPLAFINITQKVHGVYNRLQRLCQIETLKDSLSLNNLNLAVA